MFINNFDPVAFQIFSIEIRWYSLSYIVGLVFGWYFAKNKLIKDSIQKEYFDDYITYLIISIILGGRLGYVIIYDPIYFINNPFEIIKIWQGGMSFHGALIGIIIGTHFFCKNKKQNIFSYLDLVAVCSPIGIFFGRISNFINSELYGVETNVPWLVMLGICTHLGCVPLTDKGDYDGWFCPCHGSHYDTSGRIRKGPAPTNMEIPKYEFVNTNTIKIG
ncbi:prolipoprotein diacylglyceryl transferase [Candidatus Pelagibacter sp.]|nr:prolipoprotein diacylglyceryl transferase [Candidatus Pelagibacter sp.]